VPGPDSAKAKLFDNLGSHRAKWIEEIAGIASLGVFMAVAIFTVDLFTDWDDGQKLKASFVGVKKSHTDENASEEASWIQAFKTNNR